MSDSWEDWDNDNYIFPVLIDTTERQLKQIEERKLIEESEIYLARDLIYTNIKDNIKDRFKDLNYKQPEGCKEPTKIAQISNKPKKVNDKQKENEEKQKKISKKLKEEKAKILKHQEIFGYVANNDKYAVYEDEIYKKIL